MKKTALAFCILFIMSLAVYSQDSKAPAPGDDTALPDYPVQSIHPYEFTVNNFTVSRTYEQRGRGEILKVEFSLRNKTDDPMDLYVFAIATYETYGKGKAGVHGLNIEREIAAVRNFVPFPAKIEKKDGMEIVNLDNFKYSIGSGESKKDVVLKFPRDPKLGVNPSTNAPYRLVDELYVKTMHYSPYRKNYHYFNHVTLLVFDVKKMNAEKGHVNPLFRQVYRIDGRRK